MPKLCMSECSDNMIPDQFHQSLRDELAKRLNIDLDDDKWQQVDSILPQPFRDMKDTTVDNTPSIRSSLSQYKEPDNMLQHIQKAWNSIVAFAQAKLLSRANSNTNEAHLLAAASRHSGDWLQAPPIMAVGRQLDDETIRVAVVYRWGLRPY